MASERRRQYHAQRVSFEHAVGSSLDPNMENFEEYERHFAGEPLPREPSPPSDIFLETDDVDVEVQHPAAMDSSSFDDADWPEPPDADMDMDFSSPPTSPIKAHHAFPTEDQVDSFVDLLLASPCPNCHAPFSLHLEHDSGQPAIVCAVCTNSFPLGEAESSWASAHPTPSS